MSETASAALATGQDQQQQPVVPEWMAIALSYLLIAWLFGAQLFIVWWKKQHPDQYRLATLLGLLVLPPAFAIWLGNWRFVVCCAVFIVQAAYTIYLATRRPMHPDTPQFIFRFFLVMHRVTFTLGMGGVFTFFIVTFILPPFFNLELPIIMVDSVLFGFYGAYFGCVQRDLAQVISDQISRAIAPALQMSKHNACALCGHELRSADALEFGKQKESGMERKVWKLNCNHEFHEECIRGWAVVGKRSVCPKCGEKAVDTNAILASSPWEKTSGFWLEIMDILRMSLVWNPIIFLGIRVVFFLLTGM